MRHIYWIISLFLLFSSRQTFGRPTNGLDLQPRGSGSDSSPSRISPSHSKGKAPMYQSTGMLEDIVHQALRRPPSPSHTIHSSGTLPAHSHTSTGPYPQTHTKQPGQLGHLVDGLHPLRVEKKPGVPARRGGRPLGSKNKPKSSSQSVAVKPLQAKPARPAKGSKWWNTPGGRPRPALSAYGTGPRYASQKRYREKKKLAETGKLPDEHPTKHLHHPPGGPGSPGAGSHAVRK